jgi:hypothetical protein
MAYYVWRNYLLGVNVQFLVLYVCRVLLCSVVVCRWVRLRWPGHLPICSTYGTDIYQCDSSEAGSNLLFFPCGCVEPFQIVDILCYIVLVLILADLPS